MAAQARVALNGLKALDKLHACLNQPADCPVLLLPDVNLPVMGGIDFSEVYQGRR